MGGALLRRLMDVLRWGPGVLLLILGLGLLAYALS